VCSSDLMRSLQAAKSSELGTDICLVHYEQLVDTPESEIKRICAFLEVPFEQAMLDVGQQNSSYFSVKEDHKQRGISAGSRDRWRTELTPTEIWLTQKICGDEQHSLGYESVQVSLGLKDLGSLFGILIMLPGRVFNLLFRTGKPFTMAKLKRVLGKTN